LQGECYVLLHYANVLASILSLLVLQYANMHGGGRYQEDLVVCVAADTHEVPDHNNSCLMSARPVVLNNKHYWCCLVNALASSHWTEIKRKG